MSLFQRLKRPFNDGPDADVARPPPAQPVGAILRERREELGLDLDAIGEALRIRPGYLAALEQGRAEELPGPTYAIGFIRAYAQYLGLDSERVLKRYKAETSDIHIRPDLTLPVPLGERSLPGGPILLVALILALCGYGTWYYLSTGERSRPERVAAVPAELQQATRATETLPAGTDEPSAAAQRLASGLPSSPDRSAPDSAAPSPAGVAGGTAEAAPPSPLARTPAANDGTSPGAPAPSADASAKSDDSIDIRALADCWIQVRAGDSQSVVFSRVLKAGETYHVPRPGLLLRTGNAGALAITVDGKPAPPIGRIGTLRRNVALDPAALLAGTAVHG